MLQFKDQYHILNGMFFCFTKNTNAPILSINHSVDIMRKYEVLYGHKFDTLTKENFIIQNLYIHCTFMPSTNISTLNQLKTLDPFKGQWIDFKFEIVNFMKFFNEDIEYLFNKYSAKHLPDHITSELIAKKIKPISHFLILSHGYPDAHNDILQYKRLIGTVAKYNRQMMLYLNFKPEALETIKTTIKNKITFGF